MYIKISNKKFIISVSLILMALVILPFILVQLNIPDNFNFNGRLGQNDGDYFVYFSQMEQARQGHIFFNNVFTTYEHDPLIFNPIWLVLGWVGSITGLSNQLIFHFVRIILVLIFIWSAWRIVTYFLYDKAEKIVSLILILFGGGFINYSFTTDASPFNAMLFSPHLVLSLIFLIFSIINFDKYLSNKKIKNLFYSGIISLLLCIFHPYHISTLVILFGLYILIRVIVKGDYSLIKNYIFWFLFVVPVIIYYWWMFRILPFGDIWLQQSDDLMKVRTPWELIISFLPIIIFAILGLFYQIKKHNPKLLFIWIWAIAPIFLMSLSVFFRMRTTGGFLIPMAIMSGSGIIYFIDGIKKIQYKNILLILIITLLCFGSINIWVEIIDSTVDSSMTYYISNNQANAINWIDKNFKEEDSILSSWYISNLIAGYTGQYVYIGHGIQTPYALESYEKVRSFFNNDQSDDWRISFLIDNDIDYIWYSSWERQYGDFLIDQSDYLTKVYSNNDIVIYKFNI